MCVSVCLLCVYVCVKASAASAAVKFGTWLGLVCLADLLALKKTRMGTWFLQLEQALPY